MTKTYAQKSSAVRAAKKQFGDDFAALCTIAPVEGGFVIQTEVAKEFTPVAPAHDLLPNHVATKQEVIEVAPGVSFTATTYSPITPAAPVMAPTPIVAEESAPAPTPAMPILPAFLTAPVIEPALVPQSEPIASEEISETEAAAIQASADEVANAALVTEVNLTHDDKCPGCGIGLDNGICDFDHLAEVQGVAGAHKLQKREWACMGCGYEWGPLVAERGSKASTPTGAKRPRISTTEKPTKKVWDVADAMPGAKRKEVIEECVRQGIAYGTARTQYQHWFKCKADSAVAPIATIGADGKIVPPTK